MYCSAIHILDVRNLSPINLSPRLVTRNLLKINSLILDSQYTHVINLLQTNNVAEMLTIRHAAQIIPPGYRLHPDYVDTNWRNYQRYRQYAQSRTMYNQPPSRMDY